MLSTEFSNLFNTNLQKLFKGVFSFDSIPKSLKVGHFLVCNTANSDSSGEHWFTIYRPHLDVLEIFDSLGVTEAKLQRLLPHVKYRGIKKIKFNKTQIQSDDSQTCGHHCVYFIYERLYNQDQTFKELLSSIYSENVRANENLVSEFFKDILNCDHGTD